MVNPHFDDTIKVIGVDADGKKYDKVSRIEARGEESEIHIVLDVNSQLYPMHAGEKYRMVLSQTLNEDGSAVTTHTQLFASPKKVNKVGPPKEVNAYGTKVAILFTDKKGGTRLGCDLLFEKDGSKKSLADRFEYVMHGLLYKISDDKNQNGDAEVAVYISFGGLQLMMKGAPVKMGKFKVGQRLFLLLLKE